MMFGHGKGVLWKHEIDQIMRLPKNLLRAGVLLLILKLVEPRKAEAQDRVEYRFEDYNEDDHRIHVRTHSVGFEKEITSKITTHGLLIYDGISGATPTGEAPATGSNQLPLVHMKDIRRAATLDFSIHYGAQTTTPSFTYSEESDYISRGVSLTHSIDFNQKNTTLVFGAAHNFDSVSGGSLLSGQQKDTTDVLLGLNQILTPTTVFSANLTLGYADGYLADPYRVATFVVPDSPDPIFSDPSQTIPKSESRPRHRFKQVGFFSVTQAIKPLDASIEADYRLYHDDWGIVANTVSLTWFQKITKYLTISPNVRYYRQTAANFYAPYFKGVSFDQYANGTQIAFQDGFFYAFADDPAYPAPGPGFTFVNVPARPSYYSADYRLSELEAWTFGVGVQIRIADHFTIDGAYKRYQMHGLDGVTPQAAYPSANVFTIGAGVWF